MSGVYRNIEILTPTPSPPGECVHPAFGAGGGGREDTLAGWKGGGGSIVRKTPDTALYSIYVSTLWINIIFQHIKRSKSYNHCDHHF
jgi:hypothetical protein